MGFISYLWRMDTPDEIIRSAGWLVKQYGAHFSLLGKIPDGRDAYLFLMPEGEKNGFPFVYLYGKKQPVMEVTGTEALEIIESFADTE